MSFASLKQLKQWLSIDSSRSSDDELLQMLLDSATAQVCTYCSRAFSKKEYTDMVTTKFNGRYVVLDNYPIRTVSSVKLNGKAIQPSTSRDAFGYMFDEYGIRLIGYAVARGDWLEVVYEAGLEDAELPADLIHCVLELAGLNYREKDRIGLTSKGMAGGSSETTSFNHSMPAEVRTILNQYRRVRSVR